LCFRREATAARIARVSDGSLRKCSGQSQWREFQKLTAFGVFRSGSSEATAARIARVSDGSLRKCSGQSQWREFQKLTAFGVFRG
jgi:hypothetical protein